MDMVLIFLANAIMYGVYATETDDDEKIGCALLFIMYLCMALYTAKHDL